VADKEIPLEQKITNWLDTQGYPLEMRVAQAFQSADARVIQSEYYVDGTSGETREIDVVASWQDDIDDILVRVLLVIECKTSKDKPWILFVSDKARLAPPARVAQRAVSGLGRVALRKLSQEKTVQALSLFQLPKHPGYSLTQAFTSGNDVCYSAATSVANAAAASASEPDSQKTRLRRLDILEIIFPVVVTEARLFAASLDESLALSVREEKSGVLLWRNPLLGRPHTIIHVVTAAALPEFVASAKDSAEKLLTMCRGEFRAHIVEARDERRAKDA
jgi:hypothetical protein